MNRVQTVTQKHYRVKNPGQNPNWLHEPQTGPASAPGGPRHAQARPGRAPTPCAPRLPAASMPCLPHALVRLYLAYRARPRAPSQSAHARAVPALPSACCLRACTPSPAPSAHACAPQRPSLLLKWAVAKFHFFLYKFFFFVFNNNYYYYFQLFPTA